MTEKKVAEETAEETAVAKVEEVAPLMVFSHSMMETLDPDLAEELQGVRVDFDRAPWPSGGAGSIEVPNPHDADKPRTMTELVGVIIHNHDNRVHFPFAYGAEIPDGESNVPDCYSERTTDGTNVGSSGQRCDECARNMFVKGRGKACPDRRRIYFLLSGEDENVFVIDIPPTSYGEFKKYISWVAKNKKVATNKVITKISFIRDKNPSGQPYTKGTFSFLELLDKEGQTIAREISSRVKEFAGGTRAATVASVEADDSPF